MDIFLSSFVFNVTDDGAVLVIFHRLEVASRPLFVSMFVLTIVTYGSLISVIACLAYHW